MSEQIPNMDYNADEVIKGFKEKFSWAKPGEVQAVVKPKKIITQASSFFPCNNHCRRHSLLQYASCYEF